TYLWNDGTQTASNNNLSVGTYTITITDVNNCQSIQNVVINEPTAIVIQTNSINSNCGQANGNASVVVNGGTGGYTYQWSSGGSISNQSGNLLSGGYVVTVTDA